MSRSDARVTYERARAAHLSKVRAALEDHVGRLEWSRERIERYRDQRLRAVLAYARERSPFHARRLRGVDASSASVLDLASLPMMTKQDAQDQWDAIVTASDLTRDGAERVLAEQQWFSYTPGDRQVFSSGGSSGVRGVYVWDWQFFVSVACLAWRVQAREEWRGPPAPARLAAREAGVARTAGTGTPRRARGGRAAARQHPAVRRADNRSDGDGRHPRRRAVRRGAGGGFGRPAHPSRVVGRLARATLAGELPLRPVRVSTNSEPLLDEDRQAIREAWNVPIHNLWGSTEIGVQAVGCGVGEGLHVCEDEVVLERVDDDGVPVSADEPAARTLATGLANRTFPFIRYDRGDQVEWLSGPCACASAFARVAEIGGRRDDDFRYRTTTVPASAFRHVLGTDPRVSEYQVTQTVAGAEILVVGTPDVDTLTSSMIAALRRHGFADPEIRIRVVDRVPRNHASGKLRRFIALPQPVG